MEIENKLVLSLPPSVNHQYQNVYIKGRAMKVLTKKAKEWVDSSSPIIKEWINTKSNIPYDNKVIVYLWFYYGDNRKRDCHNMFKILFDQLEADGVVTNDKFIIPRVVDFTVDKGNARVELLFKEFTNGQI